MVAGAIKMRGLVFALCSLSGLPATPALSAAILADDYYEERVSATCPADFGFCRLNFSAIPVGKVVILERVGCVLSVSNQPVIHAQIGVSATSGGTPTRSIPLTFPRTLQTSSYHFYNTNEEIKFRIGNGRYPYVFAEYLNAANGSMECVIVGTVK